MAPHKGEAGLRARSLILRINKGRKLEEEKRSYLPTLREVLRALLEANRKVRATTVRLMDEKRLVELIALLEGEAEKLVHFKEDPKCGEDVSRALEQLHACAHDLTLKDTFRASRDLDGAVKSIADAIALLEIQEWKLDSDQGHDQ